MAVDKKPESFIETIKDIFRRLSLLEINSSSGGGTGAVDSVNGLTGTVILNQDNILDGTTNKQYSSTEKTKLAGIATGATANDTDANLKNRANHTGTQIASTISDFDTEVSNNSSVVANTAKVGVTTELKPADIDTLAELNAIITDATLIDTTDSRLSDSRTPTAHTHTASEITDFDTEVSNNSSVALNTAKITYPSTDSTKLAGIEALADVTDTANVTSAGALMDSEVDADIKTFSLPASTTISTFGASLIDDTSSTTALTTLGTARITVSTTAPSSPATNDLWVDIS
jgi:hypothetical protein